MRIVKFRAWCHSLKKFYGPRECLGDCTVVTFVDNHKRYLGNYSYGCRAPDDATQELSWRLFCEQYYVLQQFTGLTDINGREIFEGDIVKYSEGVELGDKTVEIAVVKYEEFFACFGYADSPIKDCKNYPWEGTISRPVVIGNIFENRELLK